MNENPLEKVDIKGDECFPTGGRDGLVFVYGSGCYLEHREAPGMGRLHHDGKGGLGATS